MGFLLFVIVLFLEIFVISSERRVGGNGQVIADKKTEYLLSQGNSISE